MQYYMGIDVGTTNLKVAVFQANGEMVAYHSESTPVSHPEPHFSEMDPWEVWEKIKIGIRSTVSCCEKEKICSIAISSMGEAGLLADETGKPLYPFILWYDTRAEEQYKKLESEIGFDRIYEITGQIPSVKYGMNKLLWLKEKRPELYQNAKHWLSVEDWVIYCLTGEYATDYSIAARTMAFDANTADWSEEIITAAGLRKELFPRALPGGTAVGPIREELSAEFGLKKDLIVATGGHDHACAGIAVNIQRDGVMLDSMGTAEVLMMAVEHSVPFEQLKKFGYSVYPHCGQKKYRLVSSNQACGICLQWYFENLGKDLEMISAESGVSKYTLMEERIRNEVSEEEQLLFFPFLRGSVENTKLRGTFWGMSDADKPGNYIKAIIDGLAFELRRQIEDYRKLSPMESPRVRVVGGLSKSDYIMERKNKLQGVPVEVPVCTEAASYGAALLGAIAAGQISFEELEHFYRSSRDFSTGVRSEYEGVFDRYMRIREGISKLYAE